MDNLTSIVEDTLTFIDLGVIKQYKKYRRVPPNWLKFKRIKPLLGKEYYQSENNVLMMGLSPENEWPVNQTFAARLNHEDGSWNGESFVVVHAETASRSEIVSFTSGWRGGDTCKVVFTEPRPSGVMVPGYFFTEYQNGEWVDITKNKNSGIDKNDSQYSNLVEGALAFQFNARFDWSVEIGWGYKSSLEIPTDPTGVIEMLKLREIPEGSKRRDAIVHIVSGHYRKRRNDPDSLSWVRGHFRGKTEIEHNGMKITVRPSARDMEAIAS